MFEFGAVVHHRLTGKPRGGVMRSRTITGIWLGMRFSTGENLVTFGDGLVVRARSIYEVPEEERWRSDLLEGIKGSPWAPSGTLDIL